MSETTTAAPKSPAPEALTTALTTGCALVRRSGTSPWEMPGEDRGRFLNGLVTCPVQDLEAGTGTYGFITSAKGKVLADLVVLAAGDRFFLELPESAAETAREHVLKYRIADRVEMEPLGDQVIWTVAGPAAAALLAGLVDGVPGDEWQHRRTSLAGVPVRLARRGVAPVPAWDLWLPEDGGEAVRAALVEAGAVEAGAVDTGAVDPGMVDAGSAGHAAWERLRVAAGVPRFGLDFGPDNLPQETGLEAAAVSYEKGCYLGQEVVARVHYRGGVNKGLVGLRLGAAGSAKQGEVEPGVAPGADVSYDGRSAGRLGTVAAGSGGEPAIALAILHSRAAEPGTVVEVEGGGEATVVSLPFEAA